MDRRRQDPNYQVHETPPAGDDRAPDQQPALAEGESGRPEESFQETNRRQNMQRRNPEEVRETEREHGSPTAPEGDQAVP